MKEKVQAAAGRAGATFGAAAPFVRRVAEDERTRAALRDMIRASREVAGELRGLGGRDVARQMFRNGRLSEELESGARGLHQVARHMARTRARERRRRTARVVLLVTGIGAAAFGAWKAIKGSGRMGDRSAESPAMGRESWTAAPPAPAEPMMRSAPVGGDGPAAGGSSPTR